MPCAISLFPLEPSVLVPFAHQPSCDERSAWAASQSSQRRKKKSPSECRKWGGESEELKTSFSLFRRVHLTSERRLNKKREKKKTLDRPHFPFLKKGTCSAPVPFFPFPSPAPAGPAAIQMLRTLAARALASATASSSSSSSPATTTAASIVAGASCSSSFSSLFSSRSYAAGTNKSKSTNNDADYGLAAGVSEELLNREVRRRERREKELNEQKEQSVALLLPSSNCFFFADEPAFFRA